MSWCRVLSPLPRSSEKLATVSVDASLYRSDILKLTSEWWFKGKPSPTTMFENPFKVFGAFFLDVRTLSFCRLMFFH